MLHIRRILHPTDLSANARHAFEVACDFAEHYNARLIVIGVIERPRIGEFVGFGSEVADARSEMQQALDEIQSTNNNVSIERRVVEGDSVVNEILRVAKEENCDMIVMGTHGRTGIERLVLGSVAEEVAHKAPCPVLPIRDASRLFRRSASGCYEDEENACGNSNVGSATAVRLRQPRVIHQVANSPLSNSVDKTAVTTNAWIADLAMALNWEPGERTYEAFRAVLHALRDRMTTDQVIGVAAQLPLLVRGIFYEGWRPADKPQLGRTKEFAAEIGNKLTSYPFIDSEAIIRAVFGVLSKHLPGGEVEKIKSILPCDVREFWR